MSNILEKDLISLRQATKIIPTRPHIATIWRWIERGCQGHKLQSWAIGGMRYTTRDAIEEFLSRLNPESTTPKSSSPRQRQRQIEAAEKELSELGI